MNKKKFTEAEAKLLEIAVLYKISYDKLYEALPVWKQKIISSNTGQHNDNRVVVEFAQNVCSDAESEHIKLNNTKK
jgi:hypothetical protein